MLLVGKLKGGEDSCSLLGAHASLALCFLLQLFTDRAGGVDGRCSCNDCSEENEHLFLKRDDVFFVPGVYNLIL